MDAFQAAGLIQETEEGFDGFTPRANGSDDSSSGSESTTARSARSKFSHEASIQSGNRQDDASDGEVTATAAMLISNDKRESESEEEQDGSDQEDLTRSGAECSAASSVVVPPLPPSRKMVTSVTKGKFPVSPHMEVVLREAFSCGIVSEQILEPLRKDTPLPDFDYLATPELDREVFEMEKKVAAKGCNNARINMFIEALLKEDTQRTAHIMGPLLLLLHHLKETDGKLELATIEDLLSRSIGECAQVLMHMRLQRQRNVLSGLKCLTVNTDSYLKAASPSVERKLDTVQLFGPDTFAQIVTQSNTFIKSLNAIGELAELNQPSKPSTGTYARRNGGGKMKQKFVRRDKNAGHHQFDRPTTSGQSQSGQSRKPTDKRPTETRSGSFNAELGLWLPVPSDVCPELRTGRTALFIDNWRRITNDPWVLNAVSGYCLEFDSSVLPTQLYAPPQINFSQTDFDMLDKEVSEMLAKGAVCEVLFMSDSFFSQLFLIPKKDGGSRPVINLKPLNRFIEYHHFKMEGMHSLHDILRQHDYMVKLDIKDAYFCIPIHPKHRRFLRFLWNGKAYEFTCLPFGLASAPRVFTKVLKPVVSFLRSRGMRGVIYIDDLLKLARSCEEAKVRLSGAIWLLEHLGFTINVKKSCFEPSQVMVFLGFVISSTTMEISIPSDKVQKIAEQCSSFLARNSVTLRELARLLGLLNSTSQAILPSSLYCRNLQLIHRDAAQMRQGWDEYTPLTSEAKEDITLWLRCINMWNGKPLKFPAPTLKITIDASLTGWGAICGSTSTHGIWSRSELQRSINYLELMAAYLGLKVFCSNLSSAHIRIISDNISAIAYINRQGGTHSRQLCHLAIDLWSWCLDRSLFVSAEHIPGVLNTEADLESRRHFESSDWCLDPAIFKLLCNLYTCDIDLFAARHNAQLPRFFSWKPDPMAERVDSLAQDWAQTLGYAFPPFNMIGKVLQKVLDDKATILLLVPTWFSQPWYPLLLDLLIDTPFLLPHQEYLLTNPRGEPHPMITDHSLRLIACRISSDNGLRTGFLTQQLSCCSHLGQTVQQSNMLTLFRSGYLGVSQNHLIRYRLL